MLVWVLDLGMEMEGWRDQSQVGTLEVKISSEFGYFHVFQDL